MKDFSEACERNKSHILRVLQEEFRQVGDVLEVGSGTGQHAAYFARHLPHLRWHPSDLGVNHASILGWAREEGVSNVLPPRTLNVDDLPWSVPPVEGVFTANTVHIIHWGSVQNLFRGVGAVLGEGGVFCVYGPFNYNGRYTSDSNAMFDQWLKQRDPGSGIRDFEAVDVLARSHGLTLHDDHTMPANNRLLVWRRTGGKPAAASA